MSDLYSTYRYIKQASVGSVAWKALKTTGHNANPVANDIDNTYGYRISRAISELLLPKAYNPDNNGPYSEYTEFLKDTEEGDQYLREAAKLRRRARILLNQIAEAEKEKNRAAKSRYF